MKRTRNFVDDDAFDANGLLKDGRSIRVRMTAMDGAMPRASGSQSHRVTVITDGSGDPLGLQRPGWRVPARDNHRPLASRVMVDTNTAARQAAYDAYSNRQENAWRGDAASNPTKDPDLNDPDDDEDDDERPRRRKRFQKRDPFGRESGSISEEDGDRYQARYADNDAAVLQDRAPAHLARVHDGSGDSGLAMHRPGFRVTDAPLSDALQLAHDAYEHELTTAWRRGAGKEDVVPDAPTHESGTSGKR